MMSRIGLLYMYEEQDAVGLVHFPLKDSVRALQGVRSVVDNTLVRASDYIRVRFPKPQ